MLSVFLNFLRLDSWPYRMCSIMENVPCALEENISSAVVGRDAVCLLVRSQWSVVSFESSLSLLIFYLLGLAY